MLEIISKGLDIIYTFLEFVCLYRYVDIFYNRRKKGGIVKYSVFLVPRALIVCSLLTVMFLNGFVLTSPYTVILILLQCILFIQIFWKCDILNAIALAGGYFLALSVSGIVEISLTGLLGGEKLIYITTGKHGGARILYLLLFGTSWYFANTLFAMWLKKKKVNASDIKYIAFTSIIGLLGLTFIVTQMLSSFNIYITAILYGYVFLLSTGIFAMYYVVKSKNLQMQMRLLNIQNEMLERNYQQISDFYTANASLFHDMNHHLKTLHHMLREGKDDQARRYIESLRVTLTSMKVKCWTGIDVVDVILNEMKRMAEAGRIHLEINVQILPQNIAMEKKDMCSLFANLLENAIEAAKEEVIVTIKYVHRMLLIQVQNDYKVKPIIKEGRLMTTKKDVLRHGLGTKNIEKVVYKYDGAIEYKILENDFYVSIIMSDV